MTRLASGRLDVGVGFVISVVVNLLFAALVFAIELGLRATPLAWNPLGIALFMLAGACSTYLGRFFFFEAIARLGSARASLFHVSSPAFTAVIAWLFLGEALRWPTVLAIAATIAGLLLVTVPAGRVRRGDGARSAGLRSWLASGLAIGVGATFAYSVGNVLRGASVREWNEPIAGALLGAIAAIILQLVLGRRNRSLLRELRAGDATAIRLYAIGGVLTIAAQMCMIASMRHIPVAIATVITLCTPLIVMPVSYWLWRNQERIGAATIGGAALTLAGMAVVVLGTR